eukprot:10267231-Alexandrium_andersonii.AAC.2
MEDTGGCATAHAVCSCLTHATTTGITQGWSSKLSHNAEGVVCPVATHAKARIPARPGEQTSRLSCRDTQLQ